jgi:hypothetical protein
MRQVVHTKSEETKMKTFIGLLIIIVAMKLLRLGAKMLDAETSKKMSEEFAKMDIYSAKKGK